MRIASPPSSNTLKKKVADRGLFGFSKRYVVSELEIRLKQRSAHWMANALRLSRESAEMRAGGENDTTEADSATENSAKAAMGVGPNSALTVTGVDGGAGLTSKGDEEHARDYKGLLPKCTEALAAIRQARKLHPGNKSEVESAARTLGFTQPKDIESLLQSRLPSTATARIIANRKSLGSHRTVRNAVGRSTKPRK
jgi:hypothetical protein